MGNKTTVQGTSSLPEPLTRTNSNGDVYQRHSVVDRQIQEALALYAEELHKRAAIGDDRSPDFLKEETLVYLIRHYHKMRGSPVPQRLVRMLADPLRILDQQ